MFSIICPVHNKENELRETIDSVFAQSFQEFQLVLIENASTDRSLEIIRSYRDERIHLIQAGKIGPGAARNLGVSQAKFPWIAFLDADDYWEKNHLQNLKSAIFKESKAFFFSTSWSIWTSTDLRPAPIQIRFGQKEGFISLKDTLQYNLLNAPPFWTSAIAVSKVAFDAVGGFPEELPAHGEDIALWIKLLQEQGGIYFINDPSARYRIDGANMTSKSFHPGQIYQISFPGFVFQEVEKIVNQSDDRDLIRLWQKFANKYQYAALSKALISDSFQKGSLNYLYVKAEWKARIVRFMLGNDLIRPLFKSYLMKNNRFHG